MVPRGWAHHLWRARTVYLCKQMQNVPTLPRYFFSTMPLVLHVSLVM